MNKKILISFGLLAFLAAGAVFINFDRSAEAAFLSGTSLPITTDNTNITIYNGSANGSVTAASFLYASDFNLKENIVPLNDSLDKIKQLQGVSFDWKSGQGSEIGLIAQDVEKVVPELVVTNAEGIKAVKYGNIVALLIEAIQEQQAEIDALRVELNGLK